ncbi:hypothetical protein HRR88_004774 [Exophiala dermatitidis]|nr:hypothetical protein HRR84_003146 [Exophiala dermatitidis]KAJ4625063.1 hypothetical protein HRR88_004774 [Exophiala dermatitidis]KAJ4630514.1 hypothetical protein HRR89_008796 [Exophiala dermatitidis]KAJ4657844.1 hypothetical protein HRR91_001624 [Exophiala dermatitidis]KAJ4683566.1 hypothetical protein HRR92_002330 [Exophiala dermatitidis]
MSPGLRTSRSSGLDHNVSSHLISSLCRLSLFQIHSECHCRHCSGIWVRSPTDSAKHTDDSRLVWPAAIITARRLVEVIIITVSTLSGRDLSQCSIVYSPVLESNCTKKIVSRQCT